MEEGVDRLSALPDGLLRRILHFVPSKEAASTSVLSRRWGSSLWRWSGAVDLAVRIPLHEYRRYRSDRFSCQKALFRAAAAALAAAEAPVTRLALRVDLERFFHSGRHCWSTDVVGAVLSHRAARHVEDLRVALVDAKDANFFSHSVEVVALGICRLDSLPSPEILRVLDLTRCDLAPAAFPRLATLRLRLCSIRLTDLQAMFDAAPELADVHLDSVEFTYTIIQQHLEPPGYDDGDTKQVAMRLPAVTTLVLALCVVLGLGKGPAQSSCDPSWALAIDAPRLRSFVYKGLLRQFQLAAPELARADLHFLKDKSYYANKERTRILFWQFVQHFSSAKALKLKVNPDLRKIAAIGKVKRTQLLFPLPNVERLELEGWHHPTSTTAAVAIANLLHCYPALRDLTLKLSDVPPDTHKGPNYASAFLERKDRLDYIRSIDRFRCRSSTVSMEDNNNGVRYQDVHDIPGLSGHSFACLQSSLRRVSLQFRLGDSSSSCLGLRLVKFFAENAVILEEMRIDTGNRRLYEHLNLSVERWIAPNTTKACSEHENLAAEGQCEFSRNPSVSIDSTTDLGRNTIGFTVLPHKRRESRVD